VSRPRLAVVGAGTWGTTLALMLAERGPVTLLTRDEAHAARIRGDGENRRYLPGHQLPAAVAVTGDPASLRTAGDLVIFAVPAAAMRETARLVAAHIVPEAILLSVAKGIEPTTLLRMTQVIGEEIADGAARAAALSGPNLALEIARGLPAGAVVGTPSDEVGRAIVALLGSRAYRLYRNRDLVGVELCGALKNVVAIAAGAAEGLGFGDNGKAAITTRGLAEMTRLGVAMGANPLTFAGLAGIGDILATCASPLSRNHRLGVELAAGRTWPRIEASLPGVAEGAYTVTAALALAERHGVELPIAREVQAVLYEGKPVRRSLEDLLARESKEELAGLVR
jgi:glycerol-3-phosphate dehydrogenase (NAD(P)+)